MALTFTLDLDDPLAFSDCDMCHVHGPCPFITLSGSFCTPECALGHIIHLSNVDIRATMSAYAQKYGRLVKPMPIEIYYDESPGRRDQGLAHCRQDLVPPRSAEKIMEADLARHTINKWRE
jgi:hypothetical protein